MILWLSVLVNAGHVVVLCICLYLTLGNLLTVYRVCLQNGRLPSRITSLLNQAESMERHHRIKDAGGEEGQIRDTMLNHSRISQLIFKYCCCYFFFFLGRVVLVTKPWVVWRGKKNSKRAANDEKSVWSWVEFKLLGLNHLPSHTWSLQRSIKLVLVAVNLDVWMSHCNESAKER